MQYLIGIQAEIAGARYEYWSSFAPLPVEVVIAAGQKAKEENLMGIFSTQKELHTSCMNIYTYLH